MQTSAACLLSLRAPAVVLVASTTASCNTWLALKQQTAAAAPHLALLQATLAAVQHSTNSGRVVSLPPAAAMVAAGQT